MTQNMREIASALADRLTRIDDVDWYEALYAAALDETKDAWSALKLADSAYQQGTRGEKSLEDYRVKGMKPPRKKKPQGRKIHEGEDCQPGWTVERTGCKPVDKPKGKDKPKKAELSPTGESKQDQGHLGQKYGVDPKGISKNSYLDAINDARIEDGVYEWTDSIEDQVLAEWEKANPKEVRTSPTVREFKEPSETSVKTVSFDEDPKARGLARSPMKKMGKLKGGLSESHLLILESGHKGVFKPHWGEARLRAGITQGEGYKGEVAAYRLAKILGFDDLVPLTTFRIDTSRKEEQVLGSIQEFIGDAENASRVGPNKMFDGPEDSARTAVFDYLVANTDRHAGNWLVDQNGKLVLIDHGYSFPHDYVEGVDFFSGDIDFWVEAKRHNYPMPDVSHMKGKWPELEKAFKDCGLSEKAITLAKQRYEAVTEGNHRYIIDLPAPDGEDIGMTVGDMVDLKYRT